MNVGDDLELPAPEKQARTMTTAIVAAHAMGGLVVFVLLGFVMPLLDRASDAEADQWETG